MVSAKAENPLRQRRRQPIFEIFEFFQTKTKLAQPKSIRPAAKAAALQNRTPILYQLYLDPRLRAPQCMKCHPKGDDRAAVSIAADPSDVQ